VHATTHDKPSWITVGLDVTAERSDGEHRLARVRSAADRLLRDGAKDWD
jgi:hypothetical protein